MIMISIVNEMEFSLCVSGTVEIHIINNTISSSRAVLIASTVALVLQNHRLRKYIAVEGYLLKNYSGFIYYSLAAVTRLIILNKVNMKI